MAEKKKRSGRRAYLDNFRRSASGEYIYTGDYYTYINSGGKPRKRALAELWAPAAACAAASLASGCLSANGAGNCIYVLLPYILELALAASVVWGMAKLSSGGDPIREYVYEASVPKLPRRAAACAIFALAGLVGEGVFLLLHGFGGKTAATLVYLALKLAAASIAMVFRGNIKRFEWQKTKK